MLPARQPASIVDHAWRLAFRIGFPLARLWWRMLAAPHEGALVAVRVGPLLLLVKSSYRREWNFPGGGVRPGEAPVDAARRELVEEIGLHAAALLPVGTASVRSDGRPDRVHLFELHLERLPDLSLDDREIVGAQLVSLSDMQGLALTAPVRSYLDGRLRAAGAGSEDRAAAKQDPASGPAPDPDRA